MLENNLSGTPILYGEVQRQVLNLGKEEQHKVVEPQREDVEVLPDSLRYALGSVLVKGVTAKIDENIKPENIKLGATILGVEGNVAVDKPDQEKTIYPSEEEQIVVGDTGFELAKVIAKPVETESFEITPSTSEQIVKASDGKYIKQVVVEAIEDIEPEIAEQETLLAELEGQVGELKDKDDTAIRVLDGTIEEFDNTKVGVEALTTYRFYGFSNLHTANFSGITNIPEYTCNNCTNLSKLVLDKNIRTIGDYAFYGCPLSGFVLNANEFCDIGEYSFNSSKMAGIDGKIGNVGQYAFAYLPNTFTHINATINGVLGSHAFYNSKYVNTLNISADSKVGSIIGDYCFYSVGTLREKPENNVFNLDFSNSAIGIIGPYAFGGSSSTSVMRYWDIRFPSTVHTINSYAFRYGDNMKLYFKGLIPPNLSANAFASATHLKICVNYASVNAYKTATNWATYADNIIGFADKDSFSQGQQLPQYSLEGYALTWYSDIALTEQVTTAETPSNYYYCTIGTEHIDVVGITSLYEDGCKISVVDSSTGYEYSEGEGIPVGTQLTIWATPTIDGYIPYILTFNGVEFATPYSYTTVGGENIDLVGVYYNGVDVPVNPDFGQNSWETIKRVVQSGAANKIWSIGQIKQIQIDGLNYGVRLSDLQQGRYKYAEGERTTNAVFEFVEIYNSSYYKMNNTNTNNGGWGNSALYSVVNTTIFNKLPNDLRGLLENIEIPSANGGDSNFTSITTSNNKLFLPSASELNLAIEWGQPNEGDTWDYYISAGDSTRIKRKPNQTNADSWWLRSPITSGSTSFTVVNSSGGARDYGASGSAYVSPCFAW